MITFKEVLCPSAREQSKHAKVRVMVGTEQGHFQISSSPRTHEPAELIDPFGLNFISCWAPNNYYILKTTCIIITKPYHIPARQY